MTIDKNPRVIIQEINSSEVKGKISLAFISIVCKEGFRQSFLGNSLQYGACCTGRGAPGKLLMTDLTEGSEEGRWESTELCCDRN